jgi:hypothetical protein
MRTPALMILLGMTVATGSVNAEDNECDRSGSKTTASPDGQWTAHVQEEVCATAAGAAAGITVVLTSTKNPEQTARVFTMPVPASRDDWPHIHWLGPDAVELRVANLSEAPAPQPAFAGIRISLAYCNDSPGDRARAAAWKAAVKQWQKDVSAWAQRRKQDAEAAGPRPDRPEEPLLSYGHCSD